MSTPLTIAGTTFNYPDSGENPNWAQEASSWAAAVTEAINTLLAPGDILQTSFSIDNNIAVATNINGLLFDSGTVRAANVSYTVYRTSTANPAGNAETGTIYLVFDDSAASGLKWKLTQSVDGNAGVSFAMGDDGQMTYRSTDIGAVGYSGTIRFSAKTLSK
jgi:hypothetical protein